MSPLAAILLFTALAAAVIVAVVRFARQREADPEMAWWRRPAIWIGASAVFALLGLFVAPRLFGFTFLFLPFLWVGGLGRRGPRQPKPSDREI